MAAARQRLGADALRGLRACVLLLLAATTVTLFSGERVVEPPSRLPTERPAAHPNSGERRAALPRAAALPAPAAPGASADNTRCFVCHANYEDEPLSVTHATNNIGCIRCHGVSSPHSTDEDGLTAPDRMFRKELLRLNCLTCHDWVKLIASDKTKLDRADLKDKPDHQAVLEGRVRDKRFCTDCHGEHRMYFRTRTWDKRSGVLVAKDGTPRMLPATPLK